jgi:LPXTG-motif cell wall-anchored protein
MQDTWFLVLMGVLLVGLIVLFIYLRNQRPED